MYSSEHYTKEDSKAEASGFTRGDGQHRDGLCRHAAQNMLWSAVPPVSQPVLQVKRSASLGRISLFPREVLRVQIPTQSSRFASFSVADGRPGSIPSSPDHHSATLWRRRVSARRHSQIAFSSLPSYGLESSRTVPSNWSPQVAFSGDKSPDMVQPVQVSPFHVFSPRKSAGVSPSSRATLELERVSSTHCPDRLLATQSADSAKAVVAAGTNLLKRRGAAPISIFLANQGSLSDSQLRLTCSSLTPKTPFYLPGGPKDDGCNVSSDRCLCGNKYSRVCFYCVPDVLPSPYSSVSQFDDDDLEIRDDSPCSDNDDDDKLLSDDSDCASDCEMTTGSVTGSTVSIQLDSSADSELILPEPVYDEYSSPYDKLLDPNEVQSRDTSAHGAALPTPPMGPCFEASSSMKKLRMETTATHDNGIRREEGPWSKLSPFPLGGEDATKVPLRVSCSFLRDVGDAVPTPVHPAASHNEAVNPLSSQGPAALELQSEGARRGAWSTIRGFMRNLSVGRSSSAFRIAPKDAGEGPSYPQTSCPVGAGVSASCFTGKKGVSASRRPHRGGRKSRAVSPECMVNAASPVVVSEGVSPLWMF